MCGTNIDWVGRLVEKISGIDLEQYFRQYISGLLGMDSTWYNVLDELEIWWLLLPIEMLTLALLLKMNIKK